MNADDVTDRFNALDIGGFQTLNFAYRAKEKLVFRLTDAGRVIQASEESIVSVYELHFNRVLGGLIEAEVSGLGEIVHWEAARKSPLVETTLRDREHVTHGEAFAHFSLIGDQGTVNVIARDFFLTAVGKGELIRDGGA